MERAGKRMHDGDEHGCPREEREEIGLWRACRNGREIAGAKQRGIKAEGAKGLEVHRETDARIRLEEHVDGKSGVWTGRANGRNVVRVGNAPAGVWRSGEERGRCSGAESIWSEADGDD